MLDNYTKHLTQKKKKKKDKIITWPPAKSTEHEHLQLNT